MKKIVLGIVLLCAFPALAQDPYPSYLAQLSVEINATHSPAQNWSYWGTKVDSMGWTDYYLQDAVSGDLKLVIHTSAPGAPLDAAFIGDSSIDIITLYRPTPPANYYDAGVLPDLATGDFAIGGEQCVGTEARFAEVEALAPRTLVIGCGANDVFWPNTPGSVDAKTALTNMMGTGTIPIIVAALVPTRPVLPTEPTKTPSLIASQIRTFTDWACNEVNAQQAAGRKVTYWNRWANLAEAQKSNYGAADCYDSDGIHAVYCNERTVAGLRYLIGEGTGK